MKTLLTIFTTLICVTAYGQREFAPFGATWFYSKIENFAGEEGYIKVVSERDTLIDNKQSKILSQKYFSSNGDSSVLNNFYIYQNGDTIYYRIDEDFHILYNFALEKGDTMEIYSKDIYCPGNESHFGEIKVDTIVNLTINGIELKKIFTSKIQGSAYKYPGPFLEIIGGLNGIHPVDSGCSCDVFPEIGDLRCYYDESFGHYHVPNSVRCDSLLTTVNPISKDVNVDILYWSEAKTFTIDLNKLNYSGEFLLKVYDVNGRSIFTNKVHSKTIKVYIPVEITGIYILQIINNQNIIYNEKICAY